MPIKSMTGFGLAEQCVPFGTCRVEIRSVNNRYSDVQIRLPKFAAVLESKIKKEIAALVSRGSISVFVTCDREGEENCALTWDKERVGAYVNILNEVKNAHNLEGNLTLGDLMRFSDFIKSESAAYSEETLWEHLRPVLAQAIEAFVESRLVEGTELAKDLKKIINDITATLAKIEERAPQRIAEYRANLAARIEKLIETDIEPQRLATEVALMAERLDITEEITRLRAHIEKFGADLELDEPVGKRIGFLLQEMNREANTIGSKANDTEISHFSISLKENIEKIREQIQNIE